MQLTIDTDELKAAAEVIYNGCVRLLSLIDGKESERLRFLDELKKTAAAKLLLFRLPTRGNKQAQILKK